MTTHEILDDICCINNTAEKAKAVVEYLFNQHSDRNRNKNLSYDTLQTFLSIAFDYVSEICEVSNRLCQLKTSDIKTGDDINTDSGSYIT